MAVSCEGVGAGVGAGDEDWGTKALYQASSYIVSVAWSVLARK